MSPECNIPHEPAALAPESPAADTAQFAESIVAALAAGGFQIRIEHTLPDGTVEAESFDVDPDEVRAAVHRAAPVDLGCQTDESQTEKGA